MANLDSAADVGSKKKKAAVADKWYVAADGKKCGIEAAVAMVYKSLPLEDAPNQGKEVTIDLRQWDANVLAGAPITMTALFGISTLATNTASFNRNSAKDEDRVADDADAVAERFARIAPGDWGTIGGGGFGIDLEVLADAVFQVTSDARMAPGTDTRAEKIAKWEASPDLRKSFRNHKQIAPVYEEMIRNRRGGVDKPLDELMAGLD